MKAAVNTLEIFHVETFTINSVVELLKRSNNYQNATIKLKRKNRILKYFDIKTKTIHVSKSQPSVS